MTATVDPNEILAVCRERDVVLTVESGRLRVSAPPGVVDDRLRDLMRAHKDGLVALLGERRPKDDGEPFARLAVRRAPLSPWQRGFWLIHKRGDGDLATLHATAVFRIAGAIDADALGRALEALAQRQEALRVRFVESDTEGVIQVAGSDGPRLAASALSEHTPDATLDEEAERLARDLSAARFDLAAEPPCRVHLLSAGGTRHRLVFVGHHLVIDGWSVTIFLRELLVLHQSFLHGRAHDLADLPVQYLDCAASYAEQASDPAVSERARRRGEELADLPIFHGFATDGKRDAADQAPDRAGFLLTRATADRLRTVARAAQGSLFAALLAGLQHVHQRLSGLDGAPVMTPVANRALDPRVEPLIGCFANAVILAPAVARDADLAKATADVAAAAIELFEDQSLPFDDVLTRSGLPRVAGAAPGAQIFFALQDAARLPNIPGVDIDVLSLPLAFGRHDLSIEFRSSADGGLACSLHYRQPLFSRPSVTALADAYREILESAARSPHVPLADFSMGASVAVRRAAPSRAYAALVPDDDEAVVDLARRLAAVAAPGEVAAWIGPLNKGRLWAARACARAGLRFLALDPELPDPACAALLRDADAVVVIRSDDLTGGAAKDGQSFGRRRPGSERADPPTNPAPAERLVVDGGKLVRVGSAELDRRRDAVAAAVERLGLRPGAGVTVDLLHASDEALELMEWLFEQGWRLRFADEGPAEPSDVLLTTRPAGRSAGQVIAYNHLGPNHAAVLADPRHGVVAVAEKPSVAEWFRPAHALVSDLFAVDGFGAALPAGLAGRLARTGAEDGSPEPIGGVARLSSDGELQIGGDAALTGSVWINGRLVDLDLGGQALAGVRGVADAALTTTEGAAGAELVAWIAPSEVGDPQRLRAAVAAALAGYARVDHVVRLRRLPYDRQGRLDRRRLALAPVVSMSVAERAAGAAGIDVGFRLTPDKPAERRAHLTDLMPKTASGLRVHPRFAQAQPALARRVGDDAGLPAFLDGGPLDDVYPASGWNPIEWLRNAARPGRVLRTIEPDGREVSISYDDLLRRARHVAGGLMRRGCGPESVVLLSVRSPQTFLAGFFGAMAAGVTVAPILPPRAWREGDPTVNRFGHVIALSEATGILSDEAVEIGTLLPADLPRFATAELEQGPETDADFRWAPDAVAIFTFTSGSTGTPKGVPLSARNLWATPASFGARFGFAPDEVCLNFTALDHVASLIGFCGSALRAGGQLAVVPVDRFLAEPDRMIERLASWRVARSWAPDFAWGMIAQGLGAAGVGKVDLAALRAVYSAGECPLNATFARLSAALARHGRSDVGLHASWGMSETTSLVTLSDAWDGEQTSLVRFGVIDNGGPVPGVCARIVDAHGDMLAEGEMGEFQVKGPSVFRGYVTLGDPEPSVDAEGWLSTGDLALIEGGRIMICGRAKEVLILNGQNVAQVEVEDRVNALEGVAPSFSVAVTCRDQRGGREALIVFFNPEPDFAPPDRLAATIRRIAGAVAAGFGARPDHVLPLPQSEIPKTGLGKLQRTQLRKRFETGGFDALTRRIDLLLANERTLPRRLAVWAEARFEPGRVEPVAGQGVFVLDDGSDAGRRLAAAIKRRGDVAVVVSPPDVGAALARHHEAIVVDADAGGEPAALVKRRLERALKWPRAAEAGRLRVVWLDDDQSADVGLACAAAIGRETENATGRSLVLDASPSGPALDMAARLVLTASQTAPQMRVAQSGTAGVMRLREADLSTIASYDGTLPGASARLLVAGGAGEAGAVLLTQLLAWTDWDFVLVGRRAPASVEPLLARISESAGEPRARLIYRQLDARDARALGDLARQERVATALNLTGRVVRTPVASLSEGEIADLIAERIGVADALDQALRESGGAVIHLTSVLASFASRDFLAYSVANAAHRQWISRHSGGPVRHVDLCCSQWRSFDGVDPLQAHLEQLGYGVIDGRLGAAGFVAAFRGPHDRLVLGLDLDGAEIAPRAAGKSTPMDRIRAIDRGKPLTDREWSALRTGTAPYGVEPEPAVGKDGEAVLGTEVERRIADLWAELLGSEMPIRADTNFFDVGGTSLLAARLHARLRDLFEKPDNVVELFAHPTPRSQARLVAGTSPADRPVGPARQAATAGRMADRRRSARASSPSGGGS